MRRLFVMLAGLSLTTTLLGCGASATIPQPPSQVTTMPPGSSPEMLKKGKGGPGGVGAAKPSNQF